jgi:hypothetical protein
MLNNVSGVTISTYMSEVSEILFSDADNHRNRRHRYGGIQLKA